MTIPFFGGGSESRFRKTIGRSDIQPSGSNGHTERGKKDMKTVSAKRRSDPAMDVVDAQDQTLGRLSTEIATG